MEFKGRDSVRTKIVIDKIIEQVNSFNYRVRQKEVPYLRS
jgi:hypothetical protein